MASNYEEDSDFVLDEDSNNDDDDDDDDDVRNSARKLTSALKQEEHDSQSTTHHRKSKKRRRINQYEPKDPNEMIWNNDVPDDDPLMQQWEDPVVDIPMLSNRTWADKSALNYLSIPEVDSLIGWATHVTSVDGNTAAAAADITTTTTTTNNTTKSRPNPLIGVQPDSPLPLSILHTLIRSKARDVFRKEPDLMGRLDTSALVAMGMVLEEMITANFLPLAEQHVQRCRQLEEDAGNNPQSFQEWTLPPEEAIYNLMTSHPVTVPTGHGLLPTACRVTKRLDSNNTQNYEEEHAFPSLLMTTRDTSETDAALRWCKSQHLSRSYVQKNMDLYQWFLPEAPRDETTTTTTTATTIGDDQDTPKEKKAAASKKKQAALSASLLENTSAQTIMTEHKFVLPDIAEALQSGLRTCAHKGCTQTTPYLCDHASCQAVKTTTKSPDGEDRILQGLYLCEQHIPHHWHDIVNKEHQLVVNDQREEGKLRHRAQRRKCSYPGGCQAMTDKVCRSPICRANAFTARGSETVYGLFFCKDHIGAHRQGIRDLLTQPSSSSTNTHPLGGLLSQTATASDFLNPE